MDLLTTLIWNLFYSTNTTPGMPGERSNWLSLVPKSDVYVVDDACLSSLRWSWMHCSTLVQEEPGLSALLLGIGANSVQQVITNSPLETLCATPSATCIFLTSLPLPCALPFIRSILTKSTYENCYVFAALGEEQHKVLVELGGNSAVFSVCKSWGMLPGQKYNERVEQAWDVDWEEWEEPDQDLHSYFPPVPPTWNESVPNPEQDEKARTIWGEWTLEYGDARDAVEGETYFHLVEQRLNRWIKMGADRHKIKLEKINCRVVHLPQLSIAGVAPAHFSSNPSTASVFLLPAVSGFFPILDYPMSEWTSYIQTGDLKLGDVSPQKQVQVLLVSCHMSNFLDCLSAQDHLHAIGDSSKLVCRGLVQCSSNKVGSQRRTVTGKSVGVLMIDRTVDLIGGGLAHGELKSAVDLVMEALAVHGDTPVTQPADKPVPTWWQQPCDVNNIPLDPLLADEDSATDVDEKWTASLSTLSDAKLWSRFLDTGVPGYLFLPSFTSPPTERQSSPTRASLWTTTGANTTQAPYIAGATLIRNLLDDCLTKDPRGWIRPKALGRPNVSQLRRMLASFAPGETEDRNSHLDVLYEETSLLTLALALTTAFTRLVEADDSDLSPRATQLPGARFDELIASEKVLTLTVSQALTEPWMTTLDARRVRDQILEQIKTILPESGEGPTFHQVLRLLTFALSLHPRLLMPAYDPEDAATFAEEEEDELERMKLVDSLVRAGVSTSTDVKDWKRGREALEEWTQRGLDRLRRIAVWKMDGGMGLPYRCMMLPGPPPLNSPFVSRYLGDLFSTLQPRARSVSPNRTEGYKKSLSGFTSLLAASASGQGEHRLADGVATHISYGVSLRALGGLAKTVGSSVANRLEGVVREGMDSAGHALQDVRLEKPKFGWGSLLGSVANTVTSTTRSLGSQLAQGLGAETGSGQVGHPLLQHPVLVIFVLGGISASEAAAVREVVRQAHSQHARLPEVLIGGTGWSQGNYGRGGLLRAIWGNVE